ncbi:MAG: isoleucine--tRNA ligase [Alphaproteobacteria bacterium]|nr:isoleucine--tRNA ligase [Alphaproteobacteria bacterium]
MSKKDDGAAGEGRDWGKTLYLPKTDFPMRAGLPKLEPKLLERWEKIGLYSRLRDAGKGRDKFVLHDGPPYANGNIHIGHALNKILKDLVVKSQQMLGHDSNYVPGWDCHGLPIEWKIEEQYRAKGRNKDDIPVNEFRAECREFADKWVDIQREEFKRLGVIGDWENPYLTMAYPAEATIAAEIMKFAMSGQLYRGSKPVMWSVVEKTALAEAEVEYEDYQSDQVWVKFPVAVMASPSGVKAEDLDKPAVKDVSDAEFARAKDLINAYVVIWTTTPWTLPGNRAISFSKRIDYGRYEVTSAPEGNWAAVGEKYILADKLAEQVMKAGKVESFERLGSVTPNELAVLACAHPLRGQFEDAYWFDVPLLDGDHVTDDTGTGFVHTAPGHGADDYIIWMNSQKMLRERGIDTTIPFTVDADGVMTDQAPGFTGKRVLKENGNKPGRDESANEAVIKALADAGKMVARARLKHQYPHSWRSKKPVIFRNTPQWFIRMDGPISPNPNVWGEGQRQDEKSADGSAPHPSPLPASGERGQVGSAAGNRSLREIALEEIGRVEWVPAAGEKRITGMIANRPDWVVSRQRAWGVPICVFRNPETDQIIPGPGFVQSAELAGRIQEAFAENGADVWFEDGAKERLLDGLVDDPAQWEQVRDVLDVWFDSGSTHAFTLEDPEHFPGLAGIKRSKDGGHDRVMYLEGSDQHRGWFHSSLLEACGTRGGAPYDVVLTHGFVLDEKGLKMSKSLKNVTAPQDVIAKSGADILRLWVAASDYSDDLRVGPEIIKTFAETYRKMRNTIRWMLGALSHFDESDRVEVADMPDLEKLMLHRLSEIGPEVRTAYAAYDYRKVVAILTQFLNTDLSAFYFDIRKDALYCDAPSSLRRKAALTAIDQIYKATTLWLAPILSFTAEEAWLDRHPSDDGSVHLQDFPLMSRLWRNEDVAERWEKVRDVRRVVTGALELERADKRIGSSLEAAPVVYIEDADLRAVVEGVDLAEVCITSGIEIVAGAPPKGAFTLADVPGVGVVSKKAEGSRCARSWRVTKDVGADADYPDLSARDAAAMREIDGKAA